MRSATHERGVTLHQELIERIGRHRSKFEFRIEISSIEQPTFWRLHPTGDRTRFMSMPILKTSQAVGQSEDRRANQSTQSIGQPFREKLDAGFFIVPHINADIEEFMRGDWPKQPLRRAPAEPGPHASHGESHQADKGLAIEEIQFEGCLALQRHWIHFEMQKQRPIPVANEQRFGWHREQPTPTIGAQSLCWINCFCPRRHGFTASRPLRFCLYPQSGRMPVSNRKGPSASMSNSRKGLEVWAEEGGPCQASPPIAFRILPCPSSSTL